MLKYNGVDSASDYFFHVVCFFVGWGALVLFTLNRVKVDRSEGPGWNPFSRLPDGSPAMSVDAVGWLGFGVLAAGLGLFFALAWLIRRWMWM